jgi:hypothetical protein
VLYCFQKLFAKYLGEYCKHWRYLLQKLNIKYLGVECRSLRWYLLQNLIEKYLMNVEGTGGFTGMMDETKGRNNFSRKST